MRYQLVDCRWELGKPGRGRELYLERHIPGASFLDVESDLSAPPSTPGGRHPLPAEHDFALAYSGWNREQTLRWLEKAYDGKAGLLVYANVDSVWDDLRSEPRFQEIVRRVGIP